MTKFEDELKNNKFVCSECVKCNHIVWPPSEFCNKCFGGVIWRPVSKKAILVESSSKDGKHFGIVEFENSIRVFGTIDGSTDLTPGQNLKLKYCNYEETPKFILQAD